jgi:hypothetical protein
MENIEKKLFEPQHVELIISESEGSLYRLEGETYELLFKNPIQVQIVQSNGQCKKV